MYCFIYPTETDTDGKKEKFVTVIYESLSAIFRTDTFPLFQMKYQTSDARVLDYEWLFSHNKKKNAESNAAFLFFKKRLEF